MALTRKDLGSRVAHQRATLGLPQKRVADHLGLPYPVFISQWENGRSPIPARYWVPLARLLAMDPTAFSVECLAVYEPEAFEALFGGAEVSRVQVELIRLVVQQNAKETNVA